MLENEELKKINKKQTIVSENVSKSRLSQLK